MIIAKLTDIIAETAVACTLLCGDGSAIDNETEDDDIPHDYAPFIDEADGREAHDNILIARLKDDRKRLRSEVRALEDELDEVKTYIPPESQTQTQTQAPESSEDKATATTGDDSGDDEPSAEGQTYNTSYYGMDCAGCSGITASGLNVKGGQTHYNGMRILAADTNILPLHTVVKVTNPDGSSYKGIVKDRGGAIVGHRLDVLVGSEAESKGHGRHTAKVEVIEIGNNKYRRE